LLGTAGLRPGCVGIPFLLLTILFIALAALGSVMKRPAGLAGASAGGH
jgi:hypothetical protein